VTTRHLLLAAVGAMLAACGPTTPNLDYRGWSDHFAFRVSTDPVPPHAREKTLYKVVVRDKDSGQPIEGGEGRIYATNADRITTWDSFTQGPELGTYYATLRFVTAGDWAVALEFRRDSTQKLEKIDWRQEVGAERPGTPP
jgi:hypothetical protein